MPQIAGATTPYLAYIKLFKSWLDSGCKCKAYGSLKYAVRADGLIIGRRYCVRKELILSNSNVCNASDMQWLFTLWPMQ